MDFEQKLLQNMKLKKQSVGKSSLEKIDTVYLFILIQCSCYDYASIVFMLCTDISFYYYYSFRLIIVGVCP